VVNGRSKVVVKCVTYGLPPQNACAVTVPASVRSSTTRIALANTGSLSLAWPTFTSTVPAVFGGNVNRSIPHRSVAVHSTVIPPARETR
jgi:hypothetical protein